jgi:thymidine kinase
MPKLYFRYGAMNSGKTAHLLVAIHEYNQTGRKTILIKPKCDTRNGQNLVWTRVPGLSRNADIILSHQRLLTMDELKACIQADCIFVDEAQFLHPRQVEQLSLTSLTVPVICYGLRTLSNGKLWPGAASLFAFADSIEEIKNICKYCSRKSTQNLKVTPSTEPVLQMGTEDTFVGVCKSCYYTRNRDPLLLDYRIHTYPDITIRDEP